MQNQASLQETKQHGAVRFPFNLYPCTIPGDFPQVALHWQESMELVVVLPWAPATATPLCLFMR